MLNSKSSSNVLDVQIPYQIFANIFSNSVGYFFSISLMISVATQKFFILMKSICISYFGDYATFDPLTGHPDRTFEISQTHSLLSLPSALG